MSSSSFPKLFCLALALTLLAALPAAAQVNFEAQLFGQNEIPGVASEGYGTCVGVLAADESDFVLSCEHTLDAAVLTGAHIHLGFSDENGPVLFGLGDPASPIQAVWDLDEDDVVRLLAGGLYVNVHTAANPAGEIRGQLRPVPPSNETRLVFPLRANLVVPPAGSTADGACVAEVEVIEGQVIATRDAEVTLRCTHDVDTPLDATIRLGGIGEEGNAVLVLDDAISPFEQTFELDTTELVNAFLAGEMYLEITSAAFPEGELRGQMLGCLEGPQTLCLNDNRFQLTVDWTTDTNSGEGTGLQQTDDSGLFWFFRPSNLELLVKVLDGCPVNDHYWVFVAGTTNVGYTLRVTDTLTGQVETYTNVRGTVALPDLDTAAFDTCP